MSSESQSAVCSRFVHNAWKKDFCSNCFKSKEEHKALKSSTKPALKQHQPDATPSKSSIKNGSKKKKYKVSFPKEVSEVIGFGGEWADSDHSSDSDGEEQTVIMHKPTETVAVDFNEQDYSKVTKSNTEFNTNIQNLIAKPPSPESNIKRSFAALKLGSSSPKEPKKESLKITVLPFSNNANKSQNKVTEMKQIFGSSLSLSGSNSPSSPVTKKNGLTVSATPLTSQNASSAVHKTEIVSTCKISTVVVNPPTFEDAKEQPTINNSPEIVSVTEKSLLEEISETLEKNKSIELAAKAPAEIVDAVPKKDAIRLEIKNPLNKVLPTPTPVTSSTSPQEPISQSPAGNKRQINRNVPITKDYVKPKISVFAKKFDTAPKEDDSDVSDQETNDFYDNVMGVTGQNKPTTPKSSSFFSSQLISDMFLANKPISKHLKSVHSEVYDLSERTYGKITSDGLIMTKSLDATDPNDSHASSNFDSSSSSSCSDEETNQRSESDSGIVSNEYQNVVVVMERQQSTVPEERGDEEGFFYDDVHSDLGKSGAHQKPDIFSLDKSRELAGEPDGSSETDSNSEVPALPNSTPPTPTPTSALLQQTDKPKVPSKPNTFLYKATSSPVLNAVGFDDTDNHRLSSLIEDMPMSDKLTVSRESSIGSLKKGRAPNPPPSPDLSGPVVLRPEDRSVDAEINTIYMRNPMANLKSSSPVIREKDKRGRATINPKFRSLNSINSFQKNAILNRATTPEPMPRKSLSMSHENLLLDGGDAKTKSMKKNKLFSIKKFLRMGSSSMNLSTSSSSSSSSSPNSKLGDIPTVECRSESGSPKAKPRLVIIHPIDINPSAVEVVKSTPTPTSASGPSDFAAKFPDDKIVSGKPPAPPVRATSMDPSKPTRPPPPKSVETRRKQQEQMSMGAAMAASPASSAPIQETSAKGVKSADTVYANLGEVRSAIAPRKPERTASMREREERQLEMMKRRAAASAFNKPRSDNDQTSTPATGTVADPIAAATNEAPHPETALNVKKESSAGTALNHSGQGKLPASKVEIFERNIVNNIGPSNVAGVVGGSPLLQPGVVPLRAPKEKAMTSGFVNSEGIKSSVQKMNSTIDNYLKDRNEEHLELNDEAEEFEDEGTQTTTEGRHQTNLTMNKFNSTNSILKDFSSPSPVVAKKMHFSDSVEMRHYEPVVVQKQDRMSLPDVMDTHGSVYGGSTCSQTLRQSPATPKGTSKSFGHLPRAVSMSYCGSEMGESDIYSPYSFYGNGSEAGGDDTYEDPQFGWNSGSVNKMRQPKTTNRLRMRKGRSVVHKNLEDNYGAVIVANHEALAQVLDQLQQSPAIPMQLRTLANSINLRFEDFSIMEGGRAVVIGRRAFHAAVWANQTPVTLSMTADYNQGVCGDLKQASGAASGALNSIAEFFDLVPSNYLPLMPSVQVRLIQASISVLPRMYVDTLTSLGNILKTRGQQMKNASAAAAAQSTGVAQKMGNAFGGSIPNLTAAQKEFSLAKNSPGSVQNLNMLNETYNEAVITDVNCGEDMEEILTLLPKLPTGFPSYDEIMCREVGFVMLQLVNGLKSLQAKGIEEMPLSLSSVILCKEMDNKEAQARLCVLQSQDNNREDEEPVGTLCQCALVALTQLLPITKLTSTFADILKQERSESLSKIKSLLEYALWGPSDITLSGTQKERELSLQRWLDLERATVLHGLVRTRVDLTVYDECHLMFLVRSTAKAMAEASVTLNNYLEE